MNNSSWFWPEVEQRRQSKEVLPRRHVVCSCGRWRDNAVRPSRDGRYETRKPSARRFCSPGRRHFFLSVEHGIDSSVTLAHFKAIPIILLAPPLAASQRTT
jgi:hypothetical protein